ncbi:MAG: signal recognition particle-docking protein FtsY [Candidatus Diapherotrites archaeon]|nr:signal recognition particle-docking protein FtsY [Candidatus Diapherotrites archaeon]
MFDLLKNKLSAFVAGVTKKAPEEKKEEIPDKRDFTPELKAITKVRALFEKEVRLREADLRESLCELELALLEADVHEDTAKKFCEEIKHRLLSKSVPKKSVDSFVKETIRHTLKELMYVDQIDIIEKAKSSQKPFKILFLGPNGAGKTTTMAKLSKLFSENGLTTIFAAADTFRAASIEQLEEHAKKLGVPLIKHKYGADPAAVAFDAINSAKAKSIDIVMIDTAGRQETNMNLIQELKKITRVTEPNIKIFVGEAFAGKTLIEQAKSFDNAIGIDAFIMTKVDADPKGGTMLSILHELKKPIIFIGTGQSYDALKRFDPEEIIERII